MDRLYTDIAVLGGGAAGLCAAIHCARTVLQNNTDKNKTFSIVIAEKNPRVGKKLLATGNGRANLAHNPIEAEHYYGEKALAEKIFSKTSGYEEFFNSLGVYCKTDNAGRVYPYSQTAASVVDALRLEAQKLGIEECVEFNCGRIEPLIEGFNLISKNSGTNNKHDIKIITARRLIITAGGMAAPSSGSDGSIFKQLQALGIKVINPLPSLCPVYVGEKLVKPLKGQRVFAKCSAVSGGKTLKAETGEVQFGENYLSGICIMNLSRLASQYGEKLTISLDLVPDLDIDSLLAFILQALKIRKSACLEDLLTGLLPKRIAAILTKQVSVHTLNTSASVLTGKEAEELAFLIKDWRFPVIVPASDNAVWQTAQCTAGGVPATELTDTLMSKKFPGLFFAGECVNIDADCGGYNLAWAWASGETAGKEAALRL